jgi:hypothetical protein
MIFAIKAFGPTTEVASDERFTLYLRGIRLDGRHIVLTEAKSGGGFVSTTLSNSVGSEIVFWSSFSSAREVPGIVDRHSTAILAKAKEIAMTIVVPIKGKGRS